MLERKRKQTRKSSKSKQNLLKIAQLSCVTKKRPVFCWFTHCQSRTERSRTAAWRCNGRLHCCRSSIINEMHRPIRRITVNVNSRCSLFHESLIVYSMIPLEFCWFDGISRVITIIGVLNCSYSEPIESLLESWKGWSTSGEIHLPPQTNRLAQTNGSIVRSEKAY